MEATGERYLPETMLGQIRLEHLNRYYFALNILDLTNKIVLDIASGEGYGSRILATKAKQVIGVDISDEAIEFAKKKYNIDNLTYKQGNATDIPLGDSTVDIVVSFETIEHHDKHHEMMQEIKRVLKPNGIMIMSSPNKMEYSDKMNNHNPYHIKELYTDEFKHLIKKYFNTTYFFGQRCFTGSIIYPRFGVITESPLELRNGETSPFEAMYDIAIASDNMQQPFAYLWIIKDDNIITTDELLQVKQNIKKSKAYKIGFIITHTLKKIKSIINRVIISRYSKK